MACNTNALSGKIVINVCDARKLGHIINYELDLCEGKITAVFVPGDCGIFGFSRSSDIRIPWDKIRKIGEDAILVEIPPKPVDCERPTQKKHFFK